MLNADTVSTSLPISCQTGLVWVTVPVCTLHSQIAGQHIDKLNKQISIRCVVIICVNIYYCLGWSVWRDNILTKAAAGQNILQRPAFIKYYQLVCNSMIQLIFCNTITFTLFQSSIPENVLQAGQAVHPAGVWV